MSLSGVGTVRRLRAVLGQFPVANHGDDEQHGKVDADAREDVARADLGDDHEDEEHAGQWKRGEETVGDVRVHPAENEDEAQEVKGQGWNPQQGNSGDVGGHVGRGAEHEAAGDRRQENPPKAARPWFQQARPARCRPFPRRLEWRPCRRAAR